MFWTHFNSISPDSLHSAPCADSKHSKRGMLLQNGGKVRVTSSHHHVRRFLRIGETKDLLLAHLDLSDMELLVPW